MRRFLHRLFGLHEVEQYTPAGLLGICACGYMDIVDATGRFY